MKIISALGDASVAVESNAYGYLEDGEIGETWRQTTNRKLG
jgi:hypothetical protein